MRGKWTEETLLARAKAAEDALLSLTCSGSEFFLRDGDEYRVDVAACLAYIRRAKESQHRAIVNAVVDRKAAEVVSKALYEALEALANDRRIALGGTHRRRIAAALSLAHPPKGEGRD